MFDARLLEAVMAGFDTFLVKDNAGGVGCVFIQEPCNRLLKQASQPTAPTCR